MNFCGVSADLLGLVFRVGFTIVRGQDFVVTLDSSTWSSSEDTGFNPVASETTSAPGYKVTLMVMSDLLLSLLTEIGTALELDGWSIGEELATSGLMTPPELDDDLVRSVIGTGRLEVWIGVLALGTLGAILRNFPWKGTASAVYPLQFLHRFTMSLWILCHQKYWAASTIVSRPGCERCKRGNTASWRQLGIAILSSIIMQPSTTVAESQKVLM